VVKLMQSNASAEGHYGPLPRGVPSNVPPSVPPMVPPPPQATQGPEQPPSSGEVNNV